MIKRVTSLLLCSFLCGGYLSAADSEEVTAEEIADLFYKLGGDPKDPHRKVNHNKGFCATGEFVPSKEANQKFAIPMLEHTSIPALVRYSLGGGDPRKSDKDKGRGVAIRLNSGDGHHWDMVGANNEIQFAKDPAEMKKFLEIRVPKEDGKPDMERLKKVTAETPSFAKFQEYINRNGITPNVANTAYHSIHTFFFVDKKGQEVPAKWKFVPTAGEKVLSKEELKNVGNDFLEKNFQDSLKKGQVDYRMFLVLANKNDPINDVTAIWQGKHTEVFMGTLSVKKFEGHTCNADVYMPSYLPEGVVAPKDPLFQLRNDAYVITFGRRQ